MQIDLVFPVLPPALDGIGDHTARLAEALAADGSAVRVLTARQGADPIPGVSIRRAFSLERRRGIRRLAAAVREDPPDWLFVQFNQFSYGRWGLNPYLPLSLRAIKHTVPGVRIAWMAHEDFVPVTSWKFALMTLWQRWQFWMLGRTADLIFFSIDPWVEKYETWFPDTPVRHLPVGSNMPRVDISRREARNQLGIDEGTFVAGVFGSAHGSRMLSWVAQAAEALNRRADNFLVLYVGPHGDAMRAALKGLPLRDAGRLPAEEVSVHLSAMDLHLTPFIDGVSTRRGSFMAGLQHGVATVATRGPLTDPMLRRADGETFLLAPVSDEAAFRRCALDLYEDSARRARLAEAGRTFYDASFAWDVTSARLLTALSEVSPAPLRPVL